MQKFLKNYGAYIAIFVLVVLTRTFLITPVKVNGTSMEKTLQSGDVMILNKIATIERDDIVVVGSEVQGSNIIKRVIALPGESIKCEDGIIYINNREYSDKYAYGITDDFEEIILDNDEYFVLGDNRLVSNDSRSFGPVPSKSIKGETKLIIFPFNKMGLVS
ncbi:MAG: signal peptidase I [Firmicutes bacterium]|nr:signal peptidase I [Bacillota bacterium]